jgi:hypothetical protein
MDQSELSLDPCHLGVPSCVPKTISKPIGHSAQTMHLSCVEINTISKRTKMSFHLTHVTSVFRRVWPKRFPCPWYIRHKSCTYLAPRLTLSPSGPKQASTWPTSTKEFHWVRPKWFPSLLHVRHKWGTYLTSRLALSPKRLKRASIWPTSPRSSIVCPRWFLSLLHVRHKWGTYLVSRLALYQKRPKRASIWPKSHRSSIICPKQFPRLWYVSPNLCTYLASILTLSPSGLNELSLDPHHLRVPSGVSKMIYKPSERSAQTVHQSCVSINTISKRTKTIFHLTHVT